MAPTSKVQSTAVAIKQKYLAIGEAAYVLGISVDTLRRWEKKGSIAAIRPNGKNRLFSEQEIKRLLANPPRRTAPIRSRAAVVSTSPQPESKSDLLPSRTDDSLPHAAKLVLKNVGTSVPNPLPKIVIPIRFHQISYEGKKQKKPLKTARAAQLTPRVHAAVERSPIHFPTDELLTVDWISDQPGVLERVASRWRTRATSEPTAAPRTNFSQFLLPLLAIPLAVVGFILIVVSVASNANQSLGEAELHTTTTVDVYPRVKEWLGTTENSVVDEATESTGILETKPK